MQTEFVEILDISAVRPHGCKDDAFMLIDVATSKGTRQIVERLIFTPDLAETGHRLFMEMAEGTTGTQTVQLNKRNWLLDTDSWQLLGAFLIDQELIVEMELDEEDTATFH